MGAIPKFVEKAFRKVDKSFDFGPSYGLAH